MYDEKQLKAQTDNVKHALKTDIIKRVHDV